MENQTLLSSLIEVRQNQSLESLRALRKYICATCATLCNCIQCYGCKSYSCREHIISESYPLCNLCAYDVRSQFQQIPEDVCWACFGDNLDQDSKIRMLLDDDKINEEEADAYRDVNRCNECNRFMCAAHAILNRDCNSCRQVVPKSGDQYTIVVAFSSDSVSAKLVCAYRLISKYNILLEDKPDELTDKAALSYVGFYCGNAATSIVNEYLDVKHVRHIWRNDARNIPDSIIAYRAGVLHNSALTPADIYAFYWMAYNTPRDYPFPNVPLEYLRTMIQAPTAGKKQIKQIL